MSRELYPDISANKQRQLRVDHIHSIYVEESGNADGIPVIFLHGGPGSGSNEKHRRYFDPQKYRIIIFDQRGCHRSTPLGECLNNRTVDLIADMEAIRKELSIEQWLLFGGSWGATLALYYAQSWPDRVLGIILRGTFLARQQDIDWFAKSGAHAVFPDYWADFIHPIPESERVDLVNAYYARVHSDNESIQQQAAVTWATWAGRTVSWMLKNVEPFHFAPEDIKNAVNEVKIETHYAKNGYFLEVNQLLRDAGLIPAVPVKIIHGRKDMTCLLEASWTLHKTLKNSTLQIVKQGGHLAGEASMVDALITATDEMAEQLSNV